MAEGATPEPSKKAEKRRSPPEQHDDGPKVKREALDVPLLNFGTKRQKIHQDATVTDFLARRRASASPEVSRTVPKHYRPLVEAVVKAKDKNEEGYVAMEAILQALGAERRALFKEVGNGSAGAYMMGAMDLELVEVIVFAGMTFVRLAQLEKPVEDDKPAPFAREDVNATPVPRGLSSLVKPTFLSKAQEQNRAQSQDRLDKWKSGPKAPPKAPAALLKTSSFRQKPSNGAQAIPSGFAGLVGVLRRTSQIYMPNDVVLKGIGMKPKEAFAQAGVKGKEDYLRKAVGLGLIELDGHGGMRLITRRSVSVEPLRPAAVEERHTFQRVRELVAARWPGYVTASTLLQMTGNESGGLMAAANVENWNDYMMSAVSAGALTFDGSQGFRAI